MKKLSAILLIVIFCSWQYARPLGYVSCSLFNSFKTAALKCDCEKQLSRSSIEKETQHPETHIHIQLDEYYTTPFFTQFVSPTEVKLSVRYPCFDEIPVSGIIQPPWQPPSLIV